MILQRTLKSSVAVHGVGLHSGQPAVLTLRPATPGFGIRFTRTDIEKSPVIPARHDHVVSTQMATTLGKNGVTISTVEHLLAALFAAGVDNVLVEVDGPEVPILDGSSEPFYSAIRAAGVVDQAHTRTVAILRKKIELRVGEKWARAEPSEGFEVRASIEWDHPAIGFQEFAYSHGKTEFSELSRARTFGFMKDYEMLKARGLARGASYDNAVVIDGEHVVNPQGLRYPDEFVRHKTLDALGDFLLAGFAIQGSIRLHRAGHDLHSQLISAILKDPSAFEIIEGSPVESFGQVGEKSGRLAAASFVAG